MNIKLLIPLLALMLALVAAAIYITAGKNFGPEPSKYVDTTGKTVVLILEGSFNPKQKENYSPNTVKVFIGVNNTVLWINKDEVPHTVTSTQRIFESNYFSQGQTWEHTFTQPGEYRYYCVPHPWMEGTVTVGSS